MVGPRYLTVVGYFLTHVQHRLVKNRLDQRHTATTASPCLGACFDLPNGLACATLDIRNEIAFGDIVT